MKTFTVAEGSFSNRSVADLYDLKDFLLLNNFDRLRLHYKDYKSYSGVLGSSARFLHGIPIEVIDPPGPPDWCGDDATSS